MKLEKKLRKDCTATLHLTAIEKKYLRIRKRETGLSLSEIIRQEYLAQAAESFFDDRKQKSQNSQPAIAATAVQ